MSPELPPWFREYDDRGTINIAQRNGSGYPHVIECPISPSGALALAADLIRFAQRHIAVIPPDRD